MQLPGRQLKNGLAVLIQQHLVLHYTSSDDLVTFYEADWESAFCLVRAGKVIKLAEDRFGPAAAEVTSSVLLQGHAAVGDLARAYSKMLRGRRGATNTHGKGMENGHETDVTGEPSQGPDRSTTLAQLDTVMTNLLNVGYVQRVRAEHFRPPTDNHNEAERMHKARSAASEGTAAKAKAELQRKIREQLRRWRDGDDVPGSHGSKRPRDAEASESPAKKIKTGSVQSNGLNGDDALENGTTLLSTLDVDHVTQPVAFPRG